MSSILTSADACAVLPGMATRFLIEVLFVETFLLEGLFIAAHFYASVALIS